MTRVTYKRSSIVNEMTINSLSLASTLEIGDAGTIHGISNAIAVQREKEIFLGNEGNFSNYDTFSKPIPIEPITEPLQLERNVLTPHIKVNKIKITALSTSSIAQIGNNKNVYLESRVRHIRHLQPRKGLENTNNELTISPPLPTVNP